MSIDPSDLVDKSAYVSTPHDPVPLQTLIWHKVEGKGQRPAARVLHSAAARDESVYIFGGLQAGARTNSLVSLDITTSTWSALAPALSGAHACPCPRAMHAACMVGSVMFVHGGEGDAPRPSPSQTSFPPPSSAAPAATPSVANANATTTSASDSASSVLSAPAPSSRHAGPTVQATGGVEGDRLGLKLKAGLRIFRPSNGRKDDGADKGSQKQQQEQQQEQQHEGSAQQQGKTGPEESREEGGDRRSLEDLWGFNTVTGEWRRVACSLAPLPRYGHSLCLAPLSSAPAHGHAHAHAHTTTASSSSAAALAPLASSSTEEHLLMFGGHCPETDSVTNAVHVCPAADVLGAFFLLGASASASAHAVTATSSSAAAATAGGAGSARLGPQWRTLQTSGPAPPSRYRHSATVLHSEGSAYLCVFGGLDRRHRPLCDAYLLDLQSLHWRQVERRTESGDWPYGVFGHSAWAAPAPPAPPASSSLAMLPASASASAAAAAAAASFPSSSSGDTCLVVFGGSGAGGGQGGEGEGEEDEGASERGCRGAMLSFDPFHPSATWRRLSGSLAAPTARVGQCACVCVGWGMKHPLPVPLQVGAPRPSPQDMLRMMDTLTPPARGGFGVVVMAGGRGENLFASDAWLLDLCWRMPGVDGYDGSVLGRTMGQLASYDQQQQQQQFQYQQYQHQQTSLSPFSSIGLGGEGGPVSLAPLDPTDPLFLYGDSRRPSLESLGVGMGTGLAAAGAGYGAGGGGMGVLLASASMPALHQTHSLGRGHPSLLLPSCSAADLGGAAFHGLRRDRAVADVSGARERERADGLQRRLDALSRQLEEEREEWARERLRHEAEGRELRQALVKAAKRESSLVALCAESQRLLVLRAVAAAAEGPGPGRSGQEMGIGGAGEVGEGGSGEGEGNAEGKEAAEGAAGGKGLGLLEEQQPV